ncbi:DUF805 domain-containing protein [Lentilactobacillus diolivorans]|uniref:DUF805 domain-containing protein n=1 Tax=Lentilactobacillus diolivorans TaxID=179838 RepID=UPI0024687EBE|nr:DUF805 domain-containing protein [Lentilactobacillus diolivorans]MDH5104610.1 DUF805 domain-containing protein [Lentilactobacillus diolivorans]
MKRTVSQLTNGERDYCSNQSSFTWGIIPDSIWHSFLLLLIFTLIVFALVADFTLRARRFHDAGISNWLVVAGLIPVFGPIFVLLVPLLPSRADLRWPINQSEM